MLERVFDLRARGTTVGRELRGAIATFLTMAYILVANAAILAAAGVPLEAAVAATALAAGVCSILMGATANFPLALAPGMGLNAVVAFQIAPATGSWQAAMGLVVLDGLIVVLLVVCGLREAVMRAIPTDLRRAIAVAIGLFIAFIGLVNARLVVVPASTAAAIVRDATAALPPVTHGALTTGPLLALVGLIVMAWLLARRVNGAIVIGIALVTVVALVLGIAPLPRAWLAVPRLDTVFAADIRAALDPRFVPMLLAIVMVDFFDTMGTVTAVGEAAQLTDADGRVPHLRRILGVDGLSASIGGAFGASSVTSYVESAAGIAEGARTGLHTVVVGMLFLASIVAAPALTMVPAVATAPALVIAGYLMSQQIARIDFETVDTALPAFLILLMVPLTYSISHGIGAGFVAYVAIKLLSGRVRDVHPLMAASAAAFAAYFVWG